MNAYILSSETAPLVKRGLLITPIYPSSVHSGATIYSLQILDALASCCETLTVVCAAKDIGHITSRQVVFPKNVQFILYSEYQSSSLRKILSWLPSMCHVNSSAISILQGELVENPELVVLDRISSTWALDYIPKNIPVIYCTHNDEFSVRMRQARYARNPLVLLYYFLDGIRIFFQDRRAFKRAALATSITSRDMFTQGNRYLHRIMDHWPPFVREQPKPVGPVTGNTPRSVCAIGSWIWQAKQCNLKKFLQHNAHQLYQNEIDIVIVGPIEDSFKQYLLSRYPFLKILGYVEDLGAVLQECRVGVLFGKEGGGFRMTWLTYMLHGRAVVTTHHLATDFPSGRNPLFFVAESEESIHDVVIQCIDDICSLNKVAERARNTCLDVFSRDAFLERVHKAVKSILKG